MVRLEPLSAKHPAITKLLMVWSREREDTERYSGIICIILHCGMFVLSRDLYWYQHGYETFKCFTWDSTVLGIRIAQITCNISCNLGD